MTPNYFLLFTGIVGVVCTLAISIYYRNNPGADIDKASMFLGAIGACLSSISLLLSLPGGKL